MAYDPKRRRVVLFGGGADLQNEATRFRNELWEMGLIPLHATLTAGSEDGMREIRWTGEAPPYQLQSCTDVHAGDWQNEGALTADVNATVQPMVQ